MPSRDKNEWESFLNHTLPMIDESFDKINYEIHRRSHSAARQLVDFFMVEIKGDTKDNYLLKPWFIEICHCVDDWYAQRYGEAITRPPESSMRGLVMHFSTLYIINVPTILKKPGENDTTWIQFPIEVFSNEEVLEWIEPSLPYQTIPEKKRITLTKAISVVATDLRIIKNELNTAEYASEKTRAMADSVLRHFEKAALDASSHDRNNSSLAIWELSMACEKTIKTYLSQKNISFPKTHKLITLHKLANNNDDWVEEKKAIAAIPSERKVVAWRYEENLPPTQKEIMRIYLASLTLCRLYASRMQRKLVFKNTSFQIRNPPRIK